MIFPDVDSQPGPFSSAIKDMGGTRRERRVSYLPGWIILQEILVFNIRGAGFLRSRFFDILCPEFNQTGEVICQSYHAAIASFMDACDMGLGVYLPGKNLRTLGHP